MAVRRLARSEGKRLAGSDVLGNDRWPAMRIHLTGPGSSRNGFARMPYQLLRSRRLRALVRRPPAHRGGMGNRIRERRIGCGADARRPLAMDRLGLSPLSRIQAAARGGGGV